MENLWPLGAHLGTIPVHFPALWHTELAWFLQPSPAQSPIKGGLIWQAESGGAQGHGLHSEQRPHAEHLTLLCVSEMALGHLKSQGKDSCAVLKFPALHRQDF